MKQVIVISRGHSGSRILPKLFMENGFYGGPTVTETGEWWGPGKKSQEWHNLMQAFMDTGTYVRPKRNWEWNFKNLDRVECPTQFGKAVWSFYERVLTGPETPAFVNYYGRTMFYNEYTVMKLPEMNFGYPFMTKMFPDAYFIHFVRHPYDVISKPHGTDKIYKWVQTSYDEYLKSDKMMSRAVSWKYQFDIVENTRRPKNFLRVRMEDFVSKPRKETMRIEDFLGVGLPSAIAVNKAAAYRYSKAIALRYQFLDKTLESLGYE